MQLFTNTKTWEIKDIVSVSGSYIATSSVIYRIENQQLVEFFNLESSNLTPHQQQIQQIIHLGTNLVIKISNSIIIKSLKNDLNDQSFIFNEQFQLKSYAENEFTFVIILLKTQIIILKYENNTFVDRYNLFLLNIKLIDFISEIEVIAMHENKSDLIHVNLSTSKVSHFDMSAFLKFNSSFLNYRRNIVSNLYTYSDHIFLQKQNEFINLTFNPSNRKPLSIKHIETFKGYNNVITVFPFIFLLHSYGVEIRSINDFKLLQDFACQNIRNIDYQNRLLRIITNEGIKEYKLCENDHMIEILQDDIDNIILMIETFTISGKFIKLRKYKLLKAISLISTDFPAAMSLMIDYLASPALVIQHLPQELSQLFELDESLIDDNQKTLINQLIRYLTDSRWKLLRLQNNNYTKFYTNGFEISLNVYNTDEGFNLNKSLNLVDNYLFKCYVLTNKKMIIPFLRRNTYCDFKLVETTCNKLQLKEQLVVFYSVKKSYDKCIELLEDHEELLKFFQKLIQLDNPPIDLIFNHKEILLEKSNFKKIFVNDDLDYSNIDYKVIIENISNSNLSIFKTEYLEYLVFNLDFHKSEIINELFEIYFTDAIANFGKIQNLFEIGIFNANQILKRLRSMSNSKEIKQLMIPPLLKLGRYDDILNIFINDLKDVNGCVEFCLKIRKIKNNSLSKGLIFKTIDLCLINKDHHSIINYILNNPDLDFINFEEILIKLPKDISMNLMSKFLVMNLKTLNAENNNIIIKNEVLRSNLFNSQLNKINLERKMTKLTQDSRCCKCNKMFNKTEILCFLPNGNILHYKCSKQREL